MSMADAVALALAHYRATTTIGIQFATTGSWWPILNPDGTPEPDARAIELSILWWRGPRRKPGASQIKIHEKGRRCTLW